MFIDLEKLMTHCFQNGPLNAEDVKFCQKLLTIACHQNNLHLLDQLPEQFQPEQAVKLLLTIKNKMQLSHWGPAEQKLSFLELFMDKYREDVKKEIGEALQHGQEDCLCYIIG